MYKLVLVINLMPEKISLKL